MDSRLSAVGKKLKSYIIDPAVWNETYEKKNNVANEGATENNIKDLQFLAKQTNDPTWLSLGDRWEKAPLDLKWLCICTKDNVWLAYKSLYLQAPLDLRYIGVLTHDPRWLHNCRTWPMTCMEQRLLGIARRDPSVARPKESAIAFDSMIDRLEKNLYGDENLMTFSQPHNKTLPYNNSTAYASHDQPIHLKLKMKINSINKEHLPHKDNEQEEKQKLHTQSLQNNSFKEPAITTLNESVQISSKKDAVASKNNKLKENMVQPRPLLTKNNVQFNKALNERQSSLSFSKPFDLKKTTLAKKTSNDTKKQNNTVTKVEGERKNEKKKTVSKLLSRLYSCEKLNNKQLLSTALSKDISTTKTLNSLIKKLSKTIESFSSSDSSSSSASSHLPSNQLSLNSESDSSLPSSSLNFSKKKSFLHNTIETIQSEESNDSIEKSVNSDISPTFNTPEKHLKKLLNIKKQSASSPVKKEASVVLSKSEKPNPPMVVRLETKHVTQPKISTLLSVDKIKLAKGLTLKKVSSESPLKTITTKDNSLVKSNAHEMEMKNVQKLVDFKSVPPPSKTVEAKEFTGLGKIPDFPNAKIKESTAHEKFSNSPKVKAKESAGLEEISDFPKVIAKEPSVLGKISNLPKFKTKIVPKNNLPQLSNLLKESSANEVLKEKNPILNELKIAPPPLVLKKVTSKKIAPKPPPKLA